MEFFITKTVLIEKPIALQVLKKSSPVKSRRIGTTGQAGRVERKISTMINDMKGRGN